LALLSLRNGEIAELKESLGAQRLKTAAYKEQALITLLSALALIAAWIIYLGYRLYRTFRR
jgi:hypothetical protein